MKQNELRVQVGACAFALALLCGCIPYPHTTRRSSEISGTVLDARTRVPIKGAKVVQSEGTWADSPKTRTRATDAAGRFRLRTSHNFHLAIAGVEGRDWPPPHYYEVVTISCPNYLSYENTGGWAEDMTVFLQPVDRLEFQGSVLDARTMSPIEGATAYLEDCMSLSCTSDASGHFRLTATPEFYQEYNASQTSGRPFRDQVSVSRGDLGWVTFHWGAPGGIGTWGNSTNLLVQPDHKRAHQ